MLVTLRISTSLIFVPQVLHLPHSSVEPTSEDQVKKLTLTEAEPQRRLGFQSVQKSHTKVLSLLEGVSP